jgi:hypothetical protein
MVVDGRITPDAGVSDAETVSVAGTSVVDSIVAVAVGTRVVAASVGTSVVGTKVGG